MRYEFEARRSSADQGTSSALARDDLVVLALTDSAQGVILSERVRAEAVPREDASQIRMAGEDDAVHVVHFAFHPLRAGPDGGDAAQLQTRVALFQLIFVADARAGAGVVLGIEEDFQPQARVVIDARQAVVHCEAMLG